ncbi:asparagine synthase C-terminal domain-containing protein [Methanoculleus sp.]|uniref:asparagine synthase C-terminal domain-containing protein n=1 Tax=Methanoculleus sp. TaxID=90427 RepID=UPI0026090A3E|nr:asparagine synthase C-terminal domain-containing protein [Methanoculleus sp.]MDI6867211.1 asparagine synthase C-terminal domain-containing protein [Methanoculleus sp.]
MRLKGWIERDGVRITTAELERMLATNPENLARCGGEFLVEWDDCTARDDPGIIPGPVPPGTICCGGRPVGRIKPDPPPCSLEEAIVTAVKLRSDEGVVAFSGGVDSALIAHLARLPCVTVGLPGSHDLARATKAARMLDLDLTVISPGKEEVADALSRVVRAIPGPPNPVDASIATTLYFVAETAEEQGHTRILAGQGADEIFGGYARYLSSTDLAAELERDFADLPRQRARDQAVAALHGAYFSMPYQDLRVVRAALPIPASIRVRGGVRKYPLRLIAERHIPAEIAWTEKKAMQYGSGIWKTIETLARANGYKKSVQRYLTEISRAEHDH